MNLKHLLFPSNRQKIFSLKKMGKNFFIIYLISFLFLLGALNVKAETYTGYLSLIEQNLFNEKFQNEDIKSRLNRIEENVYGNKSYGSVEQRVNKLKKVYKFSNPYIKISNKQKKIPPFNNSLLSQNTMINSDKSLNQNPLINYPVIDQMEARILNQKFRSEDIYKRVERLEIAVFKRNFNEDLSSRVDRLKSSIFGNMKTQPNYETQQDTITNSGFMDNNSINIILEKLEKETFKTLYPYESIETRLSRLENKIFNQTSPEDSTDDRIERLSAVISAQPTSEIYKDMSQLNQYQNVGTGLTAATIILLILKGLLL